MPDITYAVITDALKQDLKHLSLKYILNPYLLVINGKFLHLFLCLEQFSLRDKVHV